MKGWSLFLVVLKRHEERLEAAAEERVRATLKDKQQEFNELLAQLVSSLPTRLVWLHCLLALCSSTQTNQLLLVDFPI